MKKQLSALLAAALCAGALAGCGANSNSANAAASGAEDTVTLAVVSPVTGDSAEYGIHFNIGAQMAADKINEAGGINGKQVVLKSFDSKNDAMEAAEVARLICQDKTILATIGDFSSTCCMATAPIYEENKTVQISPSAGLIDFPRVGPYNFSTTGVQENDGGFLMNRVINEKMGAKSVAIVYTNNDYGLNMLSYMTQEAEADGVVITDTEAIASGEKDFTAIVSKMRQTEPEAVAIMGSYNEVANCVKQIRQVGWDVPVAISGSALTDQLVELLGDDVNDIYSNIAFVASDNTPETKEFNEEFTKRANMPPSFHSISTYDTVMLVCDAAIQCGDNLNRETLKDAIQSYKGFDGLMGPFEFTEDGAVYRGYKVVQYQDGVLTSVSDYMMVHD
ncbi:ABC transporter substrate-binding protein [Gemmiger sp.]|uniref:ABC transporter substrate-binding protein n=1 Tax=Gemmiger sp. TaxID=2049027 RepID=UPI002A756777|nr:ABC transporter substrate-binding protein [Gemmiger sp.]MDY2695502.1 ABC transporter substrate-binding protein [Gemmiger sp.]